MKRIIISVLLTLVLIMITAAPVLAGDEETYVNANAEVSGYISITLTGPGAAGLDFGVVDPGDYYGDVNQINGVPAIEVIVAEETNIDIVDISIKGEYIAGALTLVNWEYSKIFDHITAVSLTTDYVVVYADAAKGSTNPIYHWINVPAGTPAGDNSITVWYKATAVE